MDSSGEALYKCEVVWENVRDEGQLKPTAVAWPGNMNGLQVH